MDILFVATELSPMVKVGGLGDVVASLSKALKQLGHRVTVALPRYPAFEQAGLLFARRLTPLALPGGDHKREVIVLDGRLSSGVELLLLDVVEGGTSLFAGVTDASGRGVYGDGDEADAAGYRFALFSRALVELVRQRAAGGQAFDLVHVHDWPGSLVPYLLKLGEGAERTAPRSLLTIHNLAHQGLFTGASARRMLGALGLGEEHFTPQRLEFYGGISFLKGGILAADNVTTVSPTYAREILTSERGERLDGVLRARPEGVTGVLNGIDYATWNPATDAVLPARYDADDPSNKGRCKSTVLAELGMSIDPERPLFVSLGRVTHQKGSDVLAAALPRLLKQDLSLVVAGEGDAALEAALKAAAQRDPERVKVLGRVSEATAHKLLSAADFVLLPSRFEPCGLVQVHAQRYGALPVATRTGGFVDTIVDLDAKLATGTGFLIDEASEDALAGGVGRAMTAFTHPRFASVRRRIMRLDLSWERPARRYVQIYRGLVREPEPAAAPPPAPQA